MSKCATTVLIDDRLVGKFPDQPNPDINVDGSVQFYAQGGQLRYRLTRYSFDIDFEWDVDLLSYQFFPAWLALAMAENNQDGLVRGNLIDGIKRSWLSSNAGPARCWPRVLVRPRTARPVRGHAVPDPGTHVQSGS